MFWKYCKNGKRKKIDWSSKNRKNFSFKKIFFRIEYELDNQQTSLTKDCLNHPWSSQKSYQSCRSKDKNRRVPMLQKRRVKEKQEKREPKKMIWFELSFECVLWFMVILLMRHVIFQGNKKWWVEKIQGNKKKIKKRQ